LFYRKEKLRGACWEYEISGGWLEIPNGTTVRRVLRHAFSFYRPRDATIRTAHGTEIVRRAGAEQWFFPDRWFSLLRFTTEDDRTIGYYVNFSRPLQVVRENYYSDTDLELDLWLDRDGTLTELDRDEYEEEIRNQRLTPEWAAAVDIAARDVTKAVEQSLGSHHNDVEETRDPVFGIPKFILLA
jgi:protein associated with RNAse G/E